MSTKVSNSFLTKLKSFIAHEEPPHIPSENDNLSERISQRSLLVGETSCSSFEFAINRKKSNVVSNYFRSKSVSTLSPKNSVSKTKFVEKPFTVMPNEKLRAIVLDGSNVAMSHGGRRFSWQGIDIAVNEFLKRGHTEVFVVLPKSREGSVKHSIEDFKIMKRLLDAGSMIWAPSRQNIDGVRYNPYDDRFIVKSAIIKDAIIVSNDQYRDLMLECEEWKEYIRKNLLMFTFLEDTIMLPDDPMGFNGPHIDDFLKKPPVPANPWAKLRQ